MPSLYQVYYKHLYFFRYFRSWYILTILIVKDILQLEKQYLIIEREKLKEN